VRFYVLGDEATEARCQCEETRGHEGTAAEATRCGRVGFSTSRSESHRGAYGRPVPSRAATSTRSGCCSCSERCGHGTFEATWGPTCRRRVRRHRPQDRPPVTWAALMTLKSDPAYSVRSPARSRRPGSGVPQISCSPIVVQLSLADPAAAGQRAGLRRNPLAPPPGAAPRYADAQWRERPGWRSGTVGDKLDDATVQETDLHGDLRHGPTLGQLARQAGPTRSTSWSTWHSRSSCHPVPDRHDQRRRRPDRRAPGQYPLPPRLSDAAPIRASSATPATPPPCSRTGCASAAPSPRTSVWRMTGHPAEVYGLTGRGRIAAGWVSDLGRSIGHGGRGEIERIWTFPPARTGW